MGGYYMYIFEVLTPFLTKPCKARWCNLDIHAPIEPTIISCHTIYYFTKYWTMCWINQIVSQLGHIGCGGTFPIVQEMVHKKSLTSWEEKHQSTHFVGFAQWHEYSSRNFKMKCECLVLATPFSSHNMSLIRVGPIHIYLLTYTCNLDVTHLYM